MLYLLIIIRANGTMYCGATTDPMAGLDHEKHLQPGEVCFVVKAESWSVRPAH